jgi:hypothetical protein
MAKSAVPATALFHAPSSEKREKGGKKGKKGEKGVRNLFLPKTPGPRTGRKRFLTPFSSKLTDFESPEAGPSGLPREVSLCTVGENTRHHLAAGAVLLAVAGLRRRQGYGGQVGRYQVTDVP